MKKKRFYIYILSTILISPFFVSAVFAVSGACSYHQGVDCDAGAGLSGEVVCKDGWRDSSVQFRDMEMCKNLHSCSLKEMDDLFIKYNFQALTDKYKSVNNDLALKFSEYSALKSLFLKELADFEEGIHGRGITSGIVEAQRAKLLEDQLSREKIKLSELKMYSSQLELERNNLQTALTGVNRECFRLGEQAYLKSLMESSISKNQKETNNLPTCPPNSSLSKNSQCSCNPGYVLDNSKTGCVLGVTSDSASLQETCEIKYGENTVQNGSSCICKNGYTWNDSNTNCIKINKFTKNIKFGSRNNEVLELQKLLKSNGYIKGKPTNYFGSATRSALIKFQKASNLKGTGMVDSQTRDFLNTL